MVARSRPIRIFNTGSDGQSWQYDAGNPTPNSCAMRGRMRVILTTGRSPRFHAEQQAVGTGQAPVRPVVRITADIIRSLRVLTKSTTPLLVGCLRLHPGDITSTWCAHRATGT